VGVGAMKHLYIKAKTHGSSACIHWVYLFLNEEKKRKKSSSKKSFRSGCTGKGKRLRRHQVGVAAKLGGAYIGACGVAEGVQISQHRARELALGVKRIRVHAQNIT
jgi:hypothetical protein